MLTVINPAIMIEVDNPEKNLKNYDVQQRIV